MKRALLTAAVAVVVAGCGSSAATLGPAGTQSPASIPGSSATTAAASRAAAAASSSPAPPTPRPTPGPDTTVWLCRPGLASNPCSGGLDATLIDASGAETVEAAAPAADPPIDCFYVYPTVSRQKTINADLTIDPEIRAVAVAQAARFSQACRVFAPVYPQLTLAALDNPSAITIPAALTAYSGVAAAWDAYMAHYNDGRGVVLIGHSQGGFMLAQLLRSKIETDDAVRAQLVSAILLGANIMVPTGRTVGGTFSKLPACASAGQVGCVVAYSTFTSTPPADALFGRATSVLDLLPHSSTSGLQVLCVNPAAPSGGTAGLLPYVPTSGLSVLVGRSVPLPAAKTPFVGYPGQYTAHCRSADGATWLQVDATGSDRLAAALPSTNPAWGLHVADVNIALGNLVALVEAEAAAYR